MKSKFKKLETIIKEQQDRCKHEIVDLKSDNTTKLLEGLSSLTHVFYCYICKKDLKNVEYE